MGEEIESTEYRTFTEKFEHQYKDLVQKIVQIRQEAGFSQEFLSQLIEVDRRRIIALEKEYKYDIELLLLLCDKLSIELELIFKIH